MSPCRGRPSQGISDWRVLPDGRLACVVPELFGSAKVTVAEVRPKAPGDELRYYDEWWRFASVQEATAALAAWDGTGRP